MTEATYNEIITWLRGVIDGTQWEGNVFTVGGCCRDSLMHRDIHDIDLAVTVPDGGVLFAEWLEKKGLTVEPPVLFKKYSTSRLRLKRYPDLEIEVVQTRKEKYTDRTSRNPEIAFGTIEEDCVRRDLTINSLYQNVTTGELLDITGHAVEDIRECRMRTPLPPDTIFDDDPLRILRTIRFASRFGWRIPKPIFDAMVRNVQRLSIIRMERMAAEFERIIAGGNPAQSLKMLRRIKALNMIIPELCRTFRIELQDGSGRTLWEKILEDVDNAPAEAPARYAALLQDITRIRKEESADSLPRRGRGRSGMIERILNRMRYKSTFIRTVKRHLPPVAESQPLSPEERREKNRRKRQRQRHNRASRRAAGKGKSGKQDSGDGPGDEA